MALKASTSVAKRSLSTHDAIAQGFLRVEGNDLVLTAPNGRVIIEAPDVSLRAARTTIESGDLDVTAGRASLHVGEATIIADAIRTTADEIVAHVGRWELHAKRLVDDATVAVRDNRIVHTTVDRMRVIAREAIHLFAKRTAIVSEEDTTIDGKRVLLG